MTPICFNQQISDCGCQATKYMAQLMPISSCAQLSRYLMANEIQCLIRYRVWTSKFEGQQDVLNCVKMCRHHLFKPGLSVHENTSIANISLIPSCSTPLLSLPVSPAQHRVDGLAHLFLKILLELYMIGSL
jgi:hypothetical protein